MNIIKSARLQLTLWYVGALMTVSLMFSFVIYLGISQNIESTFIRAEARINSGNPSSPGVGVGQQLIKKAVQDPKISEATVAGKTTRELIHELFLEELSAAKYKVFLNLLVANGFILIASALVSYILAGKSLAPIEASMLEQKRFIADASHELRTPLTSLKTAIEVSLRDTSISKNAQEILEANLEDVDALNDLIDSLLLLASQERKTVIKQLVDIHEVINRAVKTVQPIAQEKNITILKKLQHQQILASEAGLTELLTILLDNAVKYSTSQGKVIITTKTVRNNISITVSDTGIGISKKYIPHIFDRFYRIDSCRTTSQRPGFGLGLSVAKQVVENHNGTISVSSEIGVGTTFTISLPL